MLPGVSRRAWWWLRGGSHRTRGWLTICLGVAALAVPSAVAHGADGAPPSPDLADALERSEERLDAHSQAVEEAHRRIAEYRAQQNADAQSKPIPLPKSLELLEGLVPTNYPEILARFRPDLG